MEMSDKRLTWYECQSNTTPTSIMQLKVTGESKASDLPSTA